MKAKHFRNPWMCFRAACGLDLYVKGEGRKRGPRMRPLQGTSTEADVTCAHCLEKLADPLIRHAYRLEPRDASAA